MLDDGVVTVEVPMVKFAVVDPAGTVTDDGTCATLMLLLARATTAPPPGAAAVSETVPVGCDWLFTDDWLSDTADKATPDPVAGADGLEGEADVGLGDDGVPLPQFADAITKLVASDQIQARRSAI